MSLAPICVPCERFYRPKKNGFYFTEGKPHGASVEWDGKQGKHSAGWTPYKVWAGDMWECPDCGAQIVVGVPHNRIAEHYELDFEDVRLRLNATQLLVKDCC